VTVIVDYGSGNIWSVVKAIPNAVVSKDEDIIANADRIVLPGVGSFAQAMADINILVNGLCFAKGRGVPILGICIGMQIMATTGIEGGTTNGLNWIEGDVVPITSERVPHCGWNDVTPRNINVPLGFAYFTHSYHFVPKNADDIWATTHYGPNELVSIVGRDNVMGVQFHPEKSQQYGRDFLTTWLVRA